MREAEEGQRGIQDHSFLSSQQNPRPELRGIPGLNAGVTDLLFLYSLLFLVICSPT